MSLALQAQAAGTTPLKLHLGCGANPLAGWLNTDLMPAHPSFDYLDCTRRFPFHDNVLAAAFCEHLIEHIEKPQAQVMIREVFRTLKPGGLFRIATPSLDNMARMAADPDGADAQAYTAAFRRWTKQPDAVVSDAVNAIFYHYGHRHVYSRAELTAMLEAAGYTDVKVMKAGTYGDPIFDGCDGHGRVIGEDMNALEAVGFEARKP